MLILLADTLGLCLLALACSVFSVEALVAAEIPESKAKRSADDDFETMLEQLEKKYVGGKKVSLNVKEYPTQNDIFVDKRWQDVYADPSDADVRAQEKLTAMTDAHKIQIVNLHNDKRASEGASNMHKLHYNETLAQLGQAWCQRCNFEHGQPGEYNEQTIGYKSLGQSIYADNDPAHDKFIERAANAWYGEKPDFDPNSNGCIGGKMCGHYTAYVWADTSQIGCGVCFCNSIGGNANSHFLVCNYASPGNWDKMPPFLKGAPCTKCKTGSFFCDKGLCDSSCKSPGPGCECKAACKNCADTDANSCTCKCKQGYIGPDCGDECRDIAPQCGQNPGYPEFFCDAPGMPIPTIHEDCPKMCKKCSAPPAGGAQCKRKEDVESKSLKRLMLAFLKKEETEGRLDKK